jgi:hypothetical protein
MECFKQTIPGKKTKFQKNFLKIMLFHFLRDGRGRKVAQFNPVVQQWFILCVEILPAYIYTVTPHINPLKMKRICFIYGLSAYRAVNTLHFGYKNQSLNVL